jgi:hypothetical protein
LLGHPLHDLLVGDADRPHSEVGVYVQLQAIARWCRLGTCWN